MNQIKIGKYITEKRQRKGLTQKDIAEKLLVSDKAVSKWERGICLPNIELIKPLSEILDISMESLLSGEDEIKDSNNTCVVADAVKLYGTEIKKKERNKMIIVSLIIMVLIFAFAVLPLYSKYNLSRYDKQTQDSWIKASTAIIDVLDLAYAIEKDGYVINQIKYADLKLYVYNSMEKISVFYSNTRTGEKVNSLCKEAESLIFHIMSTLEDNVQVYYCNGGECYECSPAEIQQLEDFLNSLPIIHDEINYIFCVGIYLFKVVYQRFVAVYVYMSDKRLIANMNACNNVFVIAVEVKLAKRGLTVIVLIIFCPGCNPIVIVKYSIKADFFAYFKCLHRSFRT